MFRLSSCDPALRGSIAQERGKDQLQPEGEDEKEAAEDIATGTTTAADANATGRELQQTSVQSYTSSYQSGTRFNDTSLTGISGSLPLGQPQIAQSPVVGAGPGIAFGGDAAPGAPGIAGGTAPALGT